MMRMQDVEGVTAETRARGISTMFDNTYNTPLHFNPIRHGVDVVVHSVTKYLGGHSDLMLGAAVACDGQLATRIRERRLLSGAVPGALETYLAVRGVRTLHLRNYRLEQAFRASSTRL